MGVRAYPLYEGKSVGILFKIIINIIQIKFKMCLILIKIVSIFFFFLSVLWIMKTFKHFYKLFVREINLQ